MSNHEKIDFLEFPAKDMEATKTFFKEVFNWSFKDYGPEYTDILNAGIKCGFYKSDLNASTNKGSVLIVLYSKDLKASQAKVVAAGGNIVKETFSFPGGERFHFSDPNNNEFAVWSEG